MRCRRGRPQELPLRVWGAIQLVDTIRLGGAVAPTNMERHPGSGNVSNLPVAPTKDWRLKMGGCDMAGATTRVALRVWGCFPPERQRKQCSCVAPTSMGRCENGRVRYGGGNHTGQPQGLPLRVWGCPLRCQPLFVSARVAPASMGCHFSERRRTMPHRVAPTSMGRCENGPVRYGGGNHTGQPQGLPLRV